MDTHEIKHRRQILEWRDRIIECRSSGLNVKTWCQQEGYSIKTYYRWEHEVLRMAKELMPQKETSLQVRKNIEEAVFEELPASFRQIQTDMPKVIAAISMGRNRIEIYDGASAEIISALCQGLKNAE